VAAAAEEEEAAQAVMVLWRAVLAAQRDKNPWVGQQKKRKRLLRLWWCRGGLC
jgi:hypothetical protein